MDIPRLQHSHKIRELIKPPLPLRPARRSAPAARPSPSGVGGPEQSHSAARWPPGGWRPRGAGSRPAASRSVRRRLHVRAGPGRTRVAGRTPGAAGSGADEGRRRDGAPGAWAPRPGVVSRGVPRARGRPRSPARWWGRGRGRGPGPGTGPAGTRPANPRARTCAGPTQAASGEAHARRWPDRGKRLASQEHRSLQDGRITPT